ncbi:MAG: VWA domain-containing protein [Anaerolineae bacterium]
MNHKRIPFFLIVLLTFGILLAACGGQTVEETDSTTTETGEGAGSGDLDSATGSERAGSEPPASPSGGVKVAGTRAPADTAVSEVIAAGESAEMAFADDGEIRAASGEPAIQPNSALNAGEVDDNADWDDYLLYLRDYAGAAVIEVDVSQRYQIFVRDSQGNPVLAARLAVKVNGQTIATLRTHSDGRAYFFPGAYDVAADEYEIVVTVNGRDETFTIPADSSQREWEIKHTGGDQGTAVTQLDVLFLIDATGSMADEINQLKDNIQAISAQIDALPSQPNVRFGMVTYRDKGDDFITNLFDFTPEVNEFAADLNTVFADGGGDYPEDLNEALFQAIHTPEWRVDNTVSLIFLVADAPPHLDYGQQNHYASEMLNAAARGIKIYPIASSGLDSQGEYVFRQLAQVTGGRFIFLTYGAGGPGTSGTETEFNVEDYTVSALDQLVVKIVEEELAFLAP